MNSEHNLVDILKAIFLLVQGLKNTLSYGDVSALRSDVSVTWRRDEAKLTSQLC